MLRHTMSPISGRIRDELVRAYRAPDRHYHNLAHIEAMLGLMCVHERALSDPAVVEAAIWFHDSVYDTHRHDNEERSAELAAEQLAGLLSADRIERVVKMVKATSGRKASTTTPGVIVPFFSTWTWRFSAARLMRSRLMKPACAANTAGCPKRCGSRADEKCCKVSWLAQRFMRARPSAPATKRRRARI